MNVFLTAGCAVGFVLFALVSASCRQETPAASPPLASKLLDRPIKLQTLASAEPAPLRADQVFNEVSRSVVEVTNPSAQAMGSGVEIKPGLFVTNCHVLKDGHSYFIHSHGQVAAARLEKANVRHDLCLLSATLVEVNPVQTRSSSTLAVGEIVYAIGNPEGLDLTLSEGIVSQLRRPDASETYPYIQITAAISHGSSGGGIFDKQGRLIGISSFMFLEGQNLNFAAPVDWALDLAEHSASIPTLTSLPNSRAISAMDASDLSMASSLLESALLAGTTNSEILANLGYVYLRQGRYQEAKNELVLSLKASPESASTWLNLGQALAELGQRDDAIRAILRGLDLASHKEAVVSGLQAAINNGSESENWKAVAQAALNQSQPQAGVDPRSIDESTSDRLQ